MFVEAVKLIKDSYESDNSTEEGFKFRSVDSLRHSKTAGWQSNISIHFFKLFNKFCFAGFGASTSIGFQVDDSQL